MSSLARSDGPGWRPSWSLVTFDLAAQYERRLAVPAEPLQPGLNFVVPFLDRVKPLIDLREQVVSFGRQPVIT